MAAIMQFYTADAIHDAKVLTWQNFSSHLPKMDNRRDGPGKKAYMTECEDIMRAIGDTRGGPCQHGLIIAMCGCRI